MRYFYSDGIAATELVRWGPGILKALPNIHVKTVSDVGGLGDRFYLRNKATEAEKMIKLWTGHWEQIFYGRKRKAPFLLCDRSLAPWTKLSELLPVLEVMEA